MKIQISTDRKAQISTDKKTRQSASLTIEYAVLIAIVVAALLGMQGYIRRAICGRWRQAADTFGHGRQYDPDTTTIE